MNSWPDTCAGIIRAVHVVLPNFMLINLKNENYLQKVRPLLLQKMRDTSCSCIGDGDLVIMIEHDDLINDHIKLASIYP